MPVMKQAHAEQMLLAHAATFHSSRRMSALVPDWHKWFKEVADDRGFREYIRTKQCRLPGDGQAARAEPPRLVKRLPGRRQRAAHGARGKSEGAREEMFRRVGVEFHATEVSSAG